FPALCALRGVGEGGDVPETRPRPAELQHLRPSNPAGVLAVAVVALTTGLGIALAVQPQLLLWAAGQLVLALALVQWFVVLHECGHDTLFRTRRFHPLVGRIAATFAVIPYACWTRIHGRHHRWTGWQDLDPTTAALVPRARARVERVIVNVCWKCSIPLFSVIYRLENYWHLPRLFRFFASRTERIRMVRDAIILVGLYALVAVLIGPL